MARTRALPVPQAPSAPAASFAAARALGALVAAVVLAASAGAQDGETPAGPDRAAAAEVAGAEVAGAEVAARHGEAIVDATFFEARVRPVLAERCFRCHGAGERLKGGLRLTTRAGLLAGGDFGPAVDLDDPADSLVLRMLRWVDEDHQMPPDGQLPATQLADLEAWVLAGGPWWGEGATTDTRTDHDRDGAGADTEAADAEDDGRPPQARDDGHFGWSYRRPARPEVPAVRDTAWPRNAIDHFVLARLEQAGLSPNPPADARTLYRRAHFDLTGLPPVADATEAFASSPDWSGAIDALLADPAYGERWGRHWLDVVRYAETNGFERDSDKPWIWRYRDWVVDAFNEDLPYDRFVQEQLAGDELDDADASSRIATGYHRLMQWDDEPGAGVLQGRYDVLDDLARTTAETFLGLTLGCARCHDHMGDPLPQADYARFVAFFHGVTDMSLDGYVTDVADPGLRAEADRLRAWAAERRAGLELDRVSLERRFLERYAADGGEGADGPLWRWRTEPPPAGWETPGFDDAGWRLGLPAFGTPGTVGARVGTVWDTDTIWLRRSFRWERSPESLVFVAHHDDDLDVFVNGVRAVSASGYVTGYRVFEPTPEARAALRIGENTLAVRCRQDWGGQSVHVTPVHRSWLSAGDPEHLERLAFGFDPDAPSGAGSPFAGKRVTFADLVTDRGDALWTADERARWDALAAERERVDATPIPQVLAATVQEQQPVPPLHIHVRGNPALLGDEVDPAFPACFDPPPVVLPELPDGVASSGRRRALAEWITDPSHPTAARVMVNRIWQHHFGRGLVRSPNDFGELGDRPTHPALLDWLALEFIERGWSVKAMHRLIMDSATYRMGSDSRSDALERDPLNDLFWRFERRRLGAEELRDTMLAASGRLSRERGGPSFFSRMPAEMLATSSKPDEVWGTSPPDQVDRRSLYIKVKRSLQTPILRAFDLADTDQSCPVRFATTQPTQALTLLQGDFAREMAASFAERLLREAAAARTGPGDLAGARRADGGAAPDPAALVRAAYRIALARDPTPDEQAADVAFLDELVAAGLAPEEALADFCLMLLNLNEFAYLD